MIEVRDLFKSFGRQSVLSGVNLKIESGERVVTVGAFALSKLEDDVLEKTKVQIQAPKEEEEEDEK